MDTTIAIEKSLLRDMIVADNDTAQNQPVSSEQVLNSAGGFTFALDDLKRARRFLILGCEGGTYYTGERKLALENAQCIQRLVDNGRGLDVVKLIEEVSRRGLAPKQMPTVFALAMCARSTDAPTQAAAYKALGSVCRVPTTLFAFIGFCETLSVGTGWSRAHKRAVSEWYNGHSPAKLAMLVTKYQNREGWSHRDVLRLAHVKPDTQERDFVFRFAVKGFDSLAEVPVFAEALAAPRGSALAEASIEEPVDEDEAVMHGADDLNKVAEYLAAVERCKNVEDPQELVHLIRAHGLMREHMPTAMLNQPCVWEALLSHMPMTAMIRNLGKMTSIGVLAKEEHVSAVCRALRDEAKLHKARVHPFSVLLALYTYRNGQGDKGSLTWEPVPAILEALEHAFYASFKHVQPTGQRIVLALDVSGSMGGARLMNSPITAREGAAAMAMVFARTEQASQFMAFQDDFVELDITAADKLEQVLRKTSGLPFGATDCSLPMLWAIENNVAADCFIVITDNETYAGSIHPHVALQRYRNVMRIDAKMIVVGMTATEFTIADPSDAGMLDMVGFDASAPEIMRQFLVGDV